MTIDIHDTVLTTVDTTHMSILATKRESVSTYLRNYKHKRERLPSSNTRGGRP